MKLIKDLLSLPKAETRIVGAWLRDGRPMPLEQEMSTEDMQCPDCQGTAWGTILYPERQGLRAAYCTNLECIAKHVDPNRGKRTKTLSKRRFQLKDADVPPLYHGCTLADSRQPDSVKRTLASFVKGKHHFLLISGGPGTGKTWNAIAALDLWQSETGLGGRFANVSDTSRS